MTNSLDLGDEELDDLQVEIESAFGLRLSDEEASSVQTMGNLHALLMGRIAPAGGELCLTTMAFLRLRHALAPLVPDIKLRPATLLSEIPAKSPRALFNSIHIENGLRLPPLESGTLTEISGILFSSLFVLVPVLILFKVSWLAVTGVIVAAIVSMWPLQRLDPLRFPTGCETVGDLSRAIGAHNAGALAREGAKLGPDTVWQSLVHIAAQYSFTPRPDIGRDTALRRASA